MKTKINALTVLFVILVAASLILSSCAPKPTVAPTLKAPATIPPTTTATPEPTAMVTPTPIPLLEFSLSPGQYYFNLDGQPGMIYSRNVAPFFEEDYGTLLDWSVYGGTRVIRFGLVNNPAFGGYPYTSTGELNEEVVGNIERLLDDAEAHGIHVFVWFTGWGEWNTTGQNDWANNPFNAAVGGPAQDPAEVFQEGTPANTMWFEYVNRLVTRWQDRDNILAWEVLGEANLIEGITEAQGIAFVEHMAQVIHAADSKDRPITASLGDVGTWPSFYNTDAIDFVQIHPYRPGNQLDRDIVEEVHQYLAAYDKPVLIGESGLNFEPMDEDWITASPNAQIGIEHAVWAGVVSGSMNARALFWEDAYAIYFPTTRWPFLNQYAEVELPAARFTSGVDFTGFAPLTVHYPSGTQVWGAAVGSETLVLGWFRDAGSEPPAWTLLPIIQGQTVTITVPGSTQDWQVDFYDTKTGYALSGSALLTRQGNRVTVALPDFTDDIAFKLFANTSGTLLPPPTPAPEPTAIAPTNTDPVAGEWVGSVFQVNGKWAAALHIDIESGCKVGSVCGKSGFDWCSIDLVLKEIDGDTLVFDERKVNATSNCGPGGIDRIRLQPNGTLMLKFDKGTSGFFDYSGILHRP